MKYDHQAVEKKWQERWEGEWQELSMADDESAKPKCYLLIEFPYPSGEGLHLGHPRSYVAMDIIARKRRMEGDNVLYPIGWDAFGLPAESYAVKTGQHPRVTTQKSIAVFRRQLKSLGLSFDWSREVNTSEPGYYRWTQWLFLQFFKHGLAYKARLPINWCPACKIGLANEEAVSGACERCAGPVEKREKEQWMLAITKYADQLLEGLKEVDYPLPAKIQQENWIGRSEGVEIEFAVTDSSLVIPVFTTRPDTLFGATYLVLAPEHPLVFQITTPEQKAAVTDYAARAQKKTDLERGAEGRDKTGVPSGAWAMNPANQKTIPIWIADYVLPHYGTGAIMAVPAHDQRDFEFAKKYNLLIQEVVRGGELPYLGDGVMVNSGEFNGQSNLEAGPAIARVVSGKSKVQYHLRDWVFSRQRYWGEPIPIIHCQKCGLTPVPEAELPVLLPEVENFQPTKTGESPLEAAIEWIKVGCPRCGGPAKRETDVMPSWAGSSWYFLRYLDPHNDQEFAGSAKLKYWLPVDWYNGGMEHTTLHLLYSRFWNHFFYDLGLVPVREPYKKRTSHGLILAADGEKMSKSRGNVINPDEIVQQYGADTLRCYEMFLGPFNQAAPWQPEGVVGVRRFLERVVDLAANKVGVQNQSDSESERVIHQTVKKVTADIEAMKFNTAISQLMICVNVLARAEKIPQGLFEIFLKIFFPFAPHLAEELWEKLGHQESVSKESWPEFDPRLVEEKEIDLVVQVNGRVRDRISVPTNLARNKLEERALASPKIQAFIKGQKIKKIIVARGQLVNLVLE